MGIHDHRPLEKVWIRLCSSRVSSIRCNVTIDGSFMLIGSGGCIGCRGTIHRYQGDGAVIANVQRCTEIDPYVGDFVSTELVSSSADFSTSSQSITATSPIEKRVIPAQRTSRSLNFLRKRVWQLLPCGGDLLRDDKYNQRASIKTHRSRTG